MNACYGCSPILEQVRILGEQLSPTLLKEVKHCADVALNVKSAEYANGTFKGCISTDKNIDDKTRDELLNLVHSVPAPQAQYDTWLKCYTGAVSASTKPLVVLMDSHIKDLVYCAHTQAIGGSNSDDIINLIKGMPVRIATVPTNLEWKDDQRVLDMSPALVVVHASAFYKETQKIEGNKRLLDFLDSLKNTQIKVLVYTRGLPDQRSPEIKERWDNLTSKLKDSELQSHAQLFIMPKGHQSCFDDREVSSPFEKKIKEMLAPEMASR